MLVLYITLTEYFTKTNTPIFVFILVLSAINVIYIHMSYLSMIFSFDEQIACESYTTLTFIYMLL